MSDSDLICAHIWLHTQCVQLGIHQMCCPNRRLPNACTRSAHSSLFVPTDANFTLLWLYYLPGQVWQMLKEGGVKLNLKEITSFHSSKNILTPLFYGCFVPHWLASAAVLFCYTEWITKRKLFVWVTTLLGKTKSPILLNFPAAETPPCSKTWKQFIFTNFNSYFDRLCLQCYEHYCCWDTFWLQKEHNFKSLLKEQYLVSPKSNKVPQKKNKNNCLIIYSIHLIQSVLWQTKRRGKRGNQMPNRKTTIRGCAWVQSQAIILQLRLTSLTLLSFRNTVEHYIFFQL